MTDDQRLIIHGDVVEELWRQDAKWGDQRKLDRTLWMTIFMEEVGEVAKEVLEKDTVKARTELVQCTALCYQMIAAIDDGHFKR